jgi:hypothetical protein
MNLHDALSQIADIRQQVARTATFRGYRAATTAFSGIVAVVTAGVQALWLGPTVTHVDRYLYLWLAAALVSMAVVGTEMTIRVRRAASELQRDLTLAAVEQFVPCLVAGLLLTIVLTQFAPTTVWMLPGLWMILFAMGVYSSRRALPRLAGLVGGFYLLAGLTVLAMERRAGLRPWTMGSVFGVGQLMAAGLLWYVERSDEA